MAKLKRILACALALAIAIPSINCMTSTTRDSYSAENISSNEQQTTPDIYLLCNGIIDAFPKSYVNNDWQYAIQNSGGTSTYVGKTPATSTVKYISTWRSTYSNESSAAKLYLPKTVGDYEIEGIDFVRPYTTDTPLGFLNGKSLSIYDVLAATQGVDLKPSTDNPFSVNGKPVIVINNADPSLKGSVTPWTDSTLHISKFKYAASDYSVSHTYNPSTRQIIVTTTTNWVARPSIDNPSEEGWGNSKDFGQMMEDAKTIWSQAKYHNGGKNGTGAITSQFLQQFYNLPTEPEGAEFDMYLAKYVKLASLVTLNPDGTPFKAPYSGACDFNSWKNYWKDYYTGGGLGDKVTSEDVWLKLWMGTYTEELEGSGGADNKRIYNPYVVKLKVKSKPLDLELVDTDSVNKSSGTCDAFYDKGFLYVKAVGNALELPESQKELLQETVKLVVENQTSTHINNYQGMSQPQVMTKNKPIDFLGAGTTITTLTTKLEGKPEVALKYLKLPITPSDKEQKLKVKLYINSDHSPTEVTWENNPWEKEITVPASTPDLIADSIGYTYSNNKIGQQAKVNINLVTKDRGFDQILSYLDQHKDSPVIYKVWIDGSLVKQDTYKHQFLINNYKQTFTFNTPTFTQSKVFYDCKVELEINPNRNVPKKEATFDNNKITKQFKISAFNEPKDNIDYPDPPKFTNNEECVFLDKDNPQSDSMMLFSMGTFYSTLQIDRPQPWPDSSEIQWVHLDKNTSSSDVPKGLNWGKPTSITWDAVFPDKGVDGWVTLTDNGTTGGCSYCKFDEDTYEMYQKFLTKYQCAASFVGWNKENFQSSQGIMQVVDDYGNILLLRMNSRQVSNRKKCEENCCYADKIRNHCTYEATELHGHHTHSHKVPAPCDDDCSDGCSGGHTTSCFHKICEVRGNSCPDSCSGDSLCGVTYTNKNPDHYHPHTEYRLEYVSSIKLGFNIKINKPTTKVMDYGSGDKITRAGYGIVTNITNIPYITDYQSSKVRGQYGSYVIRHFDSKSVVKTPATNKKKPYLITLLEAKDYIAPFGKKYENIKNEQSALKFKEIFTDVDYPDGQFPVLYQVLYMPDGFDPPAYQYMTNAEQKVYTKYKNKLKVGLGICTNDYITIKGNMWNDSWTHPNARN